MPVSILDLVVLGVVLISALLAAVRGFTREVLAIFAWAVAAAAAWFLHPSLLPYAEGHITNKTFALIASVAGIFLVTLVIVSIITVKISDAILDSRIGALDRTLGFAFGAARGVFLCVIGWVFLSWLVQGKMPDWAANARAKPMLQSSGDALVSLLPNNPDGLLKQFKMPQASDQAVQPPGSQTPVPPAANDQQKRTDATRAGSLAGTSERPSLPAEIVTKTTPSY